MLEVKHLNKSSLLIHYDCIWSLTMRFAAFLISLCNATQVAEKLTKKKREKIRMNRYCTLNCITNEHVAEPQFAWRKFAFHFIFNYAAFVYLWFTKVQFAANDFGEKSLCKPQFANASRRSNVVQLNCWIAIKRALNWIDFLPLTRQTNDCCTLLCSDVQLD